MIQNIGHTIVLNDILSIELNLIVLIGLVPIE